jgi:hypothetical protein
LVIRALSVHPIRCVAIYHVISGNLKINPRARLALEHWFTSTKSAVPVALINGMCG